MKWFPGSISDAVTACKQRNAIFFVFVEGDNDVSSEVARLLETEEITSKFDRNDIVTVRVKAGTKECSFFEQIYKVIFVPSLFFISSDGVQLACLGDGASQTSTVLSKLDEILERTGKKNSEASSSLIQAEKSFHSSDNVSTAGTSGSQTGTSIENSSTLKQEVNKPELTAEEKLERARQLIELQKRQKMEKEREEEKKRELERRQLGKDVQTAKQKQHEASIKLAYDERMREKAAEAEARERVRQQIAQDKLERKQRELALQQQAANQQQPNAEEKSNESSLPHYSSNDSSVARIQFRLPSGNPHMGKFDATSTLGSLRSYVSANIELPFSKFAMSTTFPRRDLNVDDDDKTLTELELVPTAVILILPVKNSKVTTVVTSGDDVGFVSRFMWALFAPIVSVYNYVLGYFTGNPTNPPERRRSNDNLPSGSSNENSDRYGRAIGQPSGLISRNLLGGPSTTIRSRGNIHRLHSGGNDNDENNTWNGNSTQQM